MSASTRRDFLKHSAAALATVGLVPSLIGSSHAAPRPVASRLAPSADAVILVWLPGGLSQTDTFDPKCYTPFRRGMRSRDLLGTCPLIPTAARGVNFGAGLERIASVMDRGCVIRSVANPAPLGNVHRIAQRVAGEAFRVALPQAKESFRSIPPVDAVGNATLSDQCRRAVESVGDGTRFVEIALPFIPYGDIDTHDFGGERTKALKRLIDAPVASLVLDLERRGLLGRTLVVVASEFGRTIAGDAAAILRSERDYGFHQHFSACSSILMFGGDVPQGIAIGHSASKHPMLPVESAMSLTDLRATIQQAVDAAPASGLA